MTKTKGSLRERLPAAWWHRRSGSPGRFVALFALLASSLLGLYYYPYPEHSTVKAWLDRYLHGYAVTAGAVLRWLDPTVRVVGRTIAGRFSLQIIKTCDAMDVTILLVSAILAWPSPWRRRAVAALASMAALFVLNVVRICSLYYVGIHASGSFDVVHLEVWPALILVAAAAAFWIFVTRGQGTAGHEAA